MSTPYLHTHPKFLRREVPARSDDPPDTFCLTPMEVFWLTAAPVCVLTVVAAFVWWCLR